MKPELVVLTDGVASVLINAAVQGYEARHKEERLGILLGRLQRDIVTVTLAKVYRGGMRKRTSADVDPERFTRRVRALTREHVATFLGTFHTHNEVAGTITSALSIADRDHLSHDPPHLVELIVAVWRSDYPPLKSQRYIQGTTGRYRFRIAAYQMYSPFKLIPVISKGAS